MALKKAWTEMKTYADPENPEDTITREVHYPAAYIVVSNYNGTKTGVTFGVTVYADSTKAAAVTRRVCHMAHSVREGAGNVVRQAYEHLKTLPEYEGAEDC